MHEDFLVLALRRVYVCNGQIVRQPRKWECRQNVRTMSKKCPKNVQKLSEGAESTIFGHFLDNFAYLVDAFFLFGDPVQCTPVTSLREGPKISEDNFLTIN